MAANKSYQSCQVATNPNRLPQQAPPYMLPNGAHKQIGPSIGCTTFVTRSVVSTEDYSVRIWAHKGNEGQAQYIESSSTYMSQRVYCPPLFIYL